MRFLKNNQYVKNWSNSKINELIGASNFVGIGINGGTITLDSTVTGGFIHISGNGSLVDTSGNTIYSGTWNGATIINEAISTKIILGDVNNNGTQTHNRHTANLTAYSDATWNHTIGSSIYRFVKWLLSLI